MKIKMLEDLINYCYEDKSKEIKDFIIERIAKSVDGNKGYIWEDCLEKSMKSHTFRLSANAKGKDFQDGSDAKFATFYRKASGILEASIGGIGCKEGFLRVCLCVPGQEHHRLLFMLIPPHAYQRYKAGSNAIKITLSPRGNVQGPLAPYVCSFEEVSAPLYKQLIFS